MAEVSGVLAPDPSSTQQAAQIEQSAAGTAPTTIPANATIGQLASSYKPLLDAIMMAIASNVCDYSKRSQQRIHDTLADAERAANG